VIPRQGDGYVIAEVQAFIDEGVVESDRLEYKQDPYAFLSAADALLKIRELVSKAVVAFANSGGGTLLLGVGEDPSGAPVRTNPEGMSALVGTQAVVEFIDRIVSRYTFPRVPATVRHALLTGAGAGRAYVVVDVAPRGAGPYRVVGLGDPKLDDRYFVRQGRASVVADHYQLRRLFAEAAEGSERVRRFLELRGFPLDVYQAFAQRPPASLVRAATTSHGGAVVITVIPEVLRDDLIDTESTGVRAVLDPGQSEMALVFGTLSHPTLEGHAVEDRHAGGNYLASYLHAHRNGYLEASDERIKQPRAGTDQTWVMAEGVQVVAQALFDRARALYSLVDMRDRVLVSVHIPSASLSRYGAYVNGGTIWGSGACFTPNMTVSEIFTVGELAETASRARLDIRLAGAYGIRDGGLIYHANGTERTHRRHFTD
jgi:hypothetical protein